MGKKTLIQRNGRLNKIFISFFLLLFSFSVNAQTAFTSEECSFKINFPQQYFLQRLCQSENQESCTYKARFTENFDDVSLSVDALCAPLSQELYESYDETFLSAFSARVYEEQGLDASDADFSFDNNSENNLKNSTAILETSKNDIPLLSIIQFWLSPQSIFTIEYRLLGEATEESQEKLATIMQSITVK